MARMPLQKPGRSKQNYATPKDCILALYGPQFTPGFDVWTWR